MTAKPTSSWAGVPIAPAARWTPRTWPGSNGQPPSPHCGLDAPLPG